MNVRWRKPRKEIALITMSNTTMMIICTIVPVVYIVGSFGMGSHNPLSDMSLTFAVIRTWVYSFVKTMNVKFVVL